MKLYHIILLVVAFFAGMAIPWYSNVKQYACKVDTFYGVAQCFRVLDDEQCGDDRNFILVSTPYATEWKEEVEGEYVEVPSESPQICVQRKSYQLQEGVIMLPDIAL